MPRARSVRRRGALCLLLPAVMLLAGCWDRRDPEKMAWATAIGIDVGPRGDYLFTFQIPVAGGAGGGGQGGGTVGGQGPGRRGGPPGNTDVFTIEAPDIITALDASQSFVARRISLTQAKVVILGEELARTDVTPVVAAATRYHEFRRNMTIMVARGKAYDFVRLAQPRMEANVSRWYELLMLTQAEAGIIPETHINDFIMETEMPGVGAKATLVAIRPDIANGQGTLDGGSHGEQDGAAPPTAGSPIAGDVRRVGEIPVEIMGAGVFKGSRLRGFLSGDESRFVSMLRGDFQHAAMAFVDPARPDRRLVLRLKPQAQPRMQVTRQGSRVRVRFTVPLEGDLVSVQSQADYSQPRQMANLETAVARQIQQRMEKLLEKTLHEWAVDLYHISNELRTTFATTGEWERFEWGEAVSRTTFEVQVRMTVRRYGLQLDPAAPKE